MTMRDEASGVAFPRAWLGGRRALEREIASVLSSLGASQAVDGRTTTFRLDALARRRLDRAAMMIRNERRIAANREVVVSNRAALVLTRAWLEAAQRRLLDALRAQAAA
jgi:hypothetical protein